MNNEAKQQLIEFHKSQIETHQKEIDKLTEQEKPTKQEPMFGQALRAKDAKFWTDYRGQICYTSFYSDDALCYGNYFVSEEAVKLEVEKRRLRQLARVRITESWGSERPKWNRDENSLKFHLNWIIDYSINGGIHVMQESKKSLLYFRTKEDAEDFLDEVGEDGIRKLLEL